MPDECSFVALCEAYRPTGGVTSGDDLDRTLRRGASGRSLARLLVAREVLGFEWRSTTWIPMAQFELRSLALKAGFVQVWSELAGDLEGWDVAAWFARRNTSLSGRRPVDVFGADLPAVLNAARTDRFISVGC